jgi:hypothetical protein
MDSNVRGDSEGRTNFTDHPGGTLEQRVKAAARRAGRAVPMIPPIMDHDEMATAWCSITCASATRKRSDSRS